MNTRPVELLTPSAELLALSLQTTKPDAQTYFYALNIVNLLKWICNSRAGILAVR
jgi:hypothetical protein